MNIIEFLKSKTNSHHNLKYYGLEDMATGMSISAFVKDLDLIVEYANKIDYKIDSVDSFIDYAYFNVAMQYEEAIPSIKPEYIEQFTKTLSKLKEIYLKFEKKDVIKYLIKNYKEVVDYQDDDEETKLFIKFDLREYTFEFLTNNINKEIKGSGYFEYLMQKDICFAFDNVESIMKVDDKYLYTFFEKENLNILFKYYRLENVIDYLLILKLNEKSYKKYKTLVDDTITYLYSYIMNQVNDDSVHIYERVLLFDKLSKFLENSNDYRLNNLKKLESELIEKQNDEIVKTGESIKFELTTEEYLKILSNEKMPIDVRFRYLTHFIKNKHFISVLEDWNENIQFGIVDDIASTSGTDDYFKATRLRNNDIFLKQGIVNITCWLNNDKLIDEFWRILSSITIQHFKNLKFDLTRDEIVSDFEWLLTGLKGYKNIDEKEEKLLNINAYYIVFHIISLFEKILRNTYLALNPYCPISKIQLGKLLNDKQYMENILGTHTQKLLQYHLSKTQKTLIGHDIRNKIMHYNDIEISQFSYTTILEYIYLLTMICNSLHTNSLKMKKSE